MPDYKLKFKSFCSLKTTWKNMETPDMSPFLHFDYMRFIKIAVTWLKPFFTRIACVCPAGSDEILMICPMKRRFDLKYYTLLGDMQGCDIADVLWKQGLTDAEKEAVIRFFFSRMTGKMYLNRIPADSPFAAGVPQERISFTRDVEYVAIDIPEDYPAYFKTLSPSVRQNIRTAYNRMKRDGIPFQLSVYTDNRQIPNDLWSRIVELYADRTGSINGLSRNWSRLMTRIKHDTHSLRTLSNTFTAVLCSDSQIMAFMTGFVNKKQDTVVIPRLAMNESFRFYSPGYILMNETLTYLGTQTAIRVLDMSRGDERYKKDFGGRSYFIKDFVVEKA